VRSGSKADRLRAGWYCAGLTALVICGCDRGSTSVTTVVFDGTTQSITGQVSCTAQPDGKLVILVSEEGGRKSVRVLLSHDARLVVHKAALRYLDAAGYVDDPDEVVATKVDDTYTFTGRMPPNPGEKEWHFFEIEATCDDVKPFSPPQPGIAG
jgi:hypothetical protein